MTPDEAARIGIPSGLYPAFRHMTAAEACTQECDDCNAVIEIHQDARWMFEAHVVRCLNCQRRAELAGVPAWQAMMVT